MPNPLSSLLVAACASRTREGKVPARSLHAVPALEQLSVDDLLDFSSAFERLGDGARTMEEVAKRLVGHLHETLVDPDGAPACALIRLYKTHRFAELDAGLQAFAERIGGGPVPGPTRCLTLLATAGVVPAWNDRRRSASHQAIPLLSAAVVEESPMIGALVRQLGLEVGDVLGSARAQLHHEVQGVFFVEEAAGHPAVPAQDDFVVPYAIRSVVGCGGVLPSGDTFALIAFTRVPVPERTADLFRSLALSLKAALVPFTFRTFTP
jgi:hypothetical protein